MTRLPSHGALLLFAATLIVACIGGQTVATPGGPVGQEPPVVNNPGGNPGAGGQLTVPQPGQLDVHPVPAQALSAQVTGRSVSILVTWTSGIEPCNVLDSIRVDRSEAIFTLTVIEGHAPGDNVCIEIAKTKQAVVELGEVEPDTYTISDGAGGAASIEVAVT